jgi:CheY-like chemotaxis protein
LWGIAALAFLLTSGLVQNKPPEVMTQKKFMLVDDNETDLFINRKLIERESIAAGIVCWQSGKSALEYLLSIGAEELPDFIFLDIKMPEMDGFAFLEEFCGAPLMGRPKVIMVTSSTAAEDIDRARGFKQCGVVDYVEKPLSIDKINHLKHAVLLN